MALGWLFIVFLVMTGISIAGVAALFLMKNETVKKYVFIGLVIWGLVIAYLEFTALPVNFTVEKISAVAIGLLGVFGLGIKFMTGHEKAANLLVTLSVLLGMFQLFFG